MAPARLQQLLQDAVAHHGAGRLDQAETLYAEARAEAPRHFDVLLLSGTLAFQQGRAAQAVGWLEAALAVNGRSALCATRLALALAAQGRPAEAEAHLRFAVRTQPDLAEAWESLGAILKAQGRSAEVVPCCERAVALRPDGVEHWYQLGLALLGAGRIGGALAAFDRALLLAPKLARLHCGRASALQQGYRTPEALGAFASALACDPGDLAARSGRLALLNCVGGRLPAQAFADHQAYGTAAAAPAWWPAVDESPHRRLRVGFLVPAQPPRAVAHFLEPLLTHLDRTEFEVVVYDDHGVVDDLATRRPAPAAVWRSLAGLAHEAVVALIRADAPDMLVDLGGHGVTGRLPVLARRVAPVQVSLPVYPNTTGLATMDYRFSDEIADPTGETDAWHTEQLVRLAPTVWTYQPPAASPPVAPAPPCAAAGVVTFGSFNNFRTVSDEVLAAWAGLLRAVPAARLRLKTPGLAEPAVEAGVRERLRRLGLPEERLELLDRTPGTAAHLTHYHGVDIALDTFPCNGTTTTCEALWMGVPVVTLAGGHHAARVGASLLQAVGRPQWIARDWNSYVQVARRLAGDRAELAALRGSLRGEMQRSALLDHAGQAARVGAALRECWRARCHRLPAVAVA